MLTVKDCKISYDVTEFPCLLEHPVHKPHLAGNNSLFRSIFCQNFNEASVYMSKMVFSSSENLFLVY